MTDPRLANAKLARLALEARLVREAQHLRVLVARVRRNAARPGSADPATGRRRGP